MEVRQGWGFPLMAVMPTPETSKCTIHPLQPSGLMLHIGHTPIGDTPQHSSYTAVDCTPLHLHTVTVLPHR